jgi:uncharacterized membrane protein
MNSNWLKAVIIVSLALNCMVAGGLTYKYFFEQSSEIKPEEPLKQSVLPMDFSPRIRNARRGFQKDVWDERSMIQQEQDRLVEFLMQETPDRKKINETLETISRNQAQVQQLVLDQILKEIQDLSPEQKMLYLSNIKSRMRCGKMFGMGRGRGRRDGRGRRNFPPK